MYKKTGSIGRRPGTGGISNVTSLVKELVKEQMQRDDQTTAYQLPQMLVDNGITISLRTILRCQTALGWTFRGSSYCQLAREATRSSIWCQRHKKDEFDDVIWTDESTVQLEMHRRFCSRNKGKAPKPKPL